MAAPTKPLPVTEPASVATEQQRTQVRDILVGDVIMAPAIEQNEQVEEEERPALRRPGQSAPAESSTPRRWYGWPILATDGAAYVLLAVAMSHERSTPYVVLPSVGGYALGGPIVHAANGQWGHAGISLLLRGALPLSGAVLGAKSSCDGGGGGDCVSTALSVGIALMAIATVIDLSVLSWKPTEPPALQPYVGATADAAWLGANGTF